MNCEPRWNTPGYNRIDPLLRRNSCPASTQGVLESALRYFGQSPNAPGVYAWVASREPDRVRSLPTADAAQESLRFVSAPLLLQDGMILVRLATIMLAAASGGNVSQKKARLNRARDLAKQMSSVRISPEISKTIMAHLLWSVETDEMKTHFADAGPRITIRLVDAIEPGNRPELTIEMARQDALIVISADVDEEMIEVVADRYHEFLEPLFPDGLIATVSVDREDGSGSQVILRVTPEDYVTA